MGQRLQQHYSRCFSTPTSPRPLRIRKARTEWEEEIHSKPEEEGERNWAKLTAGYTRVENK